MAVKSLAQSSLRQNPQINSMLAGYQPNAFHHLETVRLGGNASSVEFTNLARYSDYQHLQIRASMRTAVQSALVYISFNGDSGSNYSYHTLSGNGSSVGSGSGINATRLELYLSAASTEASGYYSGFIGDITDAFDMSKNKTFKGIHARPGNLFPEVVLNSGLWRSTNSLSSILLTAASTSFVSGCRFSLYGIKARA